MEEYELADRAHALPGRFAERIDPGDLATVREYAEAGEWGEEIGLLLACLSGARRPVTVAEEAELLALLEAMGLSAEQADKLSADGARDGALAPGWPGPRGVLCSCAVTAVVDRDLGRVFAGHGRPSCGALRPHDTSATLIDTRESWRGCRDHAGLWNWKIKRQPLLPA